MMRFAVLLALVFTVAGCATTPLVRPVKLEKAEALPLALDEAYQFRKKKLAFFFDAPQERTADQTVNFERARITHGAVESFEIRQRFGNYFTFFWRTRTGSDVTFRLEYRQSELGNQVLAQERYYPAARGSFESEFQVTGDDYLEFGRVTAWRAILIVDSKIVALQQSHNWR